MKVMAFTGNALINPGVNPLTISFIPNYLCIVSRDLYFGASNESLYILLLILSRWKAPNQPAIPPKPPQNNIQKKEGISYYFFIYSYIAKYDPYKKNSLYTVIRYPLYSPRIPCLE